MSTDTAALRQELALSIHVAAFCNDDCTDPPAKNSLEYYIADAVLRDVEPELESLRAENIRIDQARYQALHRYANANVERRAVVESLRAALRDARRDALDEVERIVKFEAGPGDVYMRADVLSAISQVRFRAAGVGTQTTEQDDLRHEAGADATIEGT
jgi:hypothetical protein